MIGPPPAVAISSPLPTGYFGGFVGSPLALAPSHWNQKGQPVIPTAHPDVTAPVLNLRPLSSDVSLPAFGFRPIGQAAATPLRNVRGSNPFVWWREQFRSGAYGRMF